MGLRDYGSLLRRHRSANPGGQPAIEVFPLQESRNFTDEVACIDVEIMRRKPFCQFMIDHGLGMDVRGALAPMRRGSFDPGLQIDQSGSLLRRCAANISIIQQDRRVLLKRCQRFVASFKNGACCTLLA